MQASEIAARRRGRTAPTNISDPNYFHKVVDCQWACPTHTPVPEYIRLIAQGRYAAAFMLNWESNVFPAILGRVCDRPCEPACRRGRVEEKPVAICRLKRVAADYKGEIHAFLPEIPKQKNGKRIALIGAGPASLTVARDLLPLGYTCVLFEKDPKGGGLMRTNIPSFRLPVAVLDEEIERIIDFGVEKRFGHEIKSLDALLKEKFDAVFIGTGAPKGKDLDIPGRKEAAANIHIGIDWLTSVAFEHVHTVGRRVVVIGGGNTAMDCCRTSLRLGGMDVKVTVRSPRRVMKASPWEIEDAEHEGIPIFDNHAPKEFLLEKGRLKGVRFQKMKEVGVDKNGRPKLEPSGEDVVFECDDVLMAIGQENSFPWIERNIGLEFDEGGMPKVDEVTMMSTRPGVFFGGDAAWGPENIIWAVEHGHHAAVSIDRFCHGKPIAERPPPGFNLISQKMGIHEWSYKNDYAPLQARGHAPCRQGAGAAQPQGGSRARLRRPARRQGGRALPQLRRADGVHGAAVHRVRRLHGHLPGRLHQLHRQRCRAGAARAPARAGAQQDAGHLRLRAPQDRAHHGQGRGHVPALRACAPSAVRPARGTCRSSCSWRRRPPRLV